MRRPALTAAALAGMLLLAGCATGPEPVDTGVDGADAGGGTTETVTDGGGFTVADVCHAIDQDIVAAEVGPVREVEEVDERYCNLWLDLPGLGNSINVSVPPPAGMGPDQVYDGTVKAREMMAKATAQPLDGIGDRAAAIQTDMGAVVIVQRGDVVVVFDPMLADGEITVDAWRRILEPAFAAL